ncbi:nitrate reductase molybdenum cofactor assembly chaperone [Geobacter sp.]|uniref:nitrate reductase molybdenum cofactor assembly chaperone n=1 Tax=Geobacter sp. TaxID=46610 RepID=UPI001AD45661|nr:nitrate reductase molybdenum cofactor assembly chaperone [Geobacter sp.]CAG0968613.1 Nitrate reductase molybdenum cofactor assembly chaperone NarJ [Geobacteraceae bacterium]
MITAELYASLARMLDYPQEKKGLLSALGLVQGYLVAERLECSLGPFGEFVTGSTLAEIQEEYVATFDFNPSVAPYLGHHLFGDNQKKGEYLIALKGEYRLHDYTPLGNELPDHLPLILWFLAHLASKGETGARQAFIDRYVVPGVEKLAGSFAASRRDSPWRPVVEAIRLICGEDAAQGVRPAEAIGHGVPEQSRPKMVMHPEVRPC